MTKKRSNKAPIRKAPPKKTPVQNTGDSRGWHLVWILTSLVWFLIVAALLSHHPGDWPAHNVSPHNPQFQNWIGKFGAVVSDNIYVMLGPGVWVGLAGILAVLAVTAVGRKINQPILRIIGLAILIPTTSAILGLFGPANLGTFFVQLIHHVPADGLENPEGAGGLIAIFINTELASRFGTFGTAVILIAAFWLGALLAVDHLVLAMPKLARWLFNALTKINLPRPVLVGRLSWPGRGSMPTASKTPTRRDKKELVIDEDTGGYGGTKSFGIETDPNATEPIIEEPDADELDAQSPITEEEPATPAKKTVKKEAKTDTASKTDQLDPQALREKFKNLPINFATSGSQGKAKVPPPREVDLSGYRFPDINLLVEPESNFSERIETWVREQAISLETALQTYRIEGEVVGVDSGPAITRYEIRLAPGTKVSSINAISSDLARAMRAHNIRVVPNMAGRDTIGIEVPNAQKEKVRLKELMTTESESVAKMRLPMFLGKDSSGNPLVGDLASMPHMLIAGTTGSGKSVCMNSIIMSFLFTKRPDELKLVLVDPKMVEMSQFKEVPHLMCPVVTDMDKAAAILEWAVTKMDERYSLLAEVGVRDIVSYNNLGWDEIKERMQPSTEEEEARIPKKLPYMVFVIDELADLIMTNKEVESFIVRIAQKARAVGLHLILATQRPQANVVTGLIKSNMPCRIAFKVASGMDSRIVLDQKGAELLLGQGDMLYLSPRTSKISRSQGTLVDEAEIRQTVKFLKTVAQQNFEPQLVQIRKPGLGTSEGQDRDPLFNDAVRVVLESQRGSVSLLQRRLTIGYSRASRLIEEMALAGIIGDYKGSQAREVNMTLDEFDALIAQADQEQLPNHLMPADTTEPAEEPFDPNEPDDDDAVPDEMPGEFQA